MRNLQQFRKSKHKLKLRRRNLKKKKDRQACFRLKMSGKFSKFLHNTFSLINFLSYCKAVNQKKRRKFSPTVWTKWLEQSNSFYIWKYWWTVYALWKFIWENNLTICYSRVILLSSRKQSNQTRSANHWKQTVECGRDRCKKIEGKNKQQREKKDIVPKNWQCCRFVISNLKLRNADCWSRERFSHSSLTLENFKQQSIQDILSFRFSIMHY